MSLDNVVVISRQVEIQEFVRQIATHVFAADDIFEAVDIADRVCPELILFDAHSSRDDIASFSNTAKNISEAHIAVIGNDDAAGMQVGSDFIDTERFHYLSNVQDNRFHKIIAQIRQQSHLNCSDKDTDVFFSDSLAASACIVGKSASIRQTLKTIKLVASSRCNPILIVGEMGTGKELAAKAIHDHRCPDKELITVNCASLSANLLESELFGHEKGAFTSADREKTGLLELAGEGSIFLDEISEMPIELQAKILRVIQEKTFRKVGGTKEVLCQATIIASSNRNLAEEVLARRFRGDLYHRLSIFPVVLSPLRAGDRREDVRLLAEYFLKTSAICPEKTGRITSITQLALEVLEKYDWPGNVRELRNVIERAILLETTNKIGLNSIVINPEKPEDLCNKDSGEKIKDFSLAKAEQKLIARVLRETNWQKTKAAELLGISRATLYAKVKQHNIESVPNGRKAEGVGGSEKLPEAAAIV